jgi:hypothetical protein
MSIKSFFPSNFLKPSDITVDEVVTIKEVRPELVGREREERPVLYLREYSRDIVLNKTNAETIAAVYGDDETTWTGKRVTLFTEMVRNVSTGQMGPAIRMAAAPSVHRPANGGRRTTVSKPNKDASADAQAPAEASEELDDPIPF